MPVSVSDNQRAGHAIRVKIPALAERMTAEQFRQRPDLAQRYGERGRRHCLKDAEYTLHFLASSVEFGDPRIFRDYITWLVDLLGRRDIPVTDVADNLRVLRLVMEESMPPDALPLVLAHVDASKADVPVQPQ